MTDWQPIETVPIRSHVLVFRPTDPQSIVVAIRPNESERIATIPGYWDIHPTHWMPLPEPPR
jgi:hypothetical protein